MMKFSTIAIRGILVILMVSMTSVSVASAKDCDREMTEGIFRHIKRFGYSCGAVTYCAETVNYPIWMAQCDGKSPISQPFRVASHNGRTKIKIDGQEICYVLNTGERLSGQECKY